MAVKRALIECAWDAERFVCGVAHDGAMFVLGVYLMLTAIGLLVAFANRLGRD